MTDDWRRWWCRCWQPGWCRQLCRQWRMQKTWTLQRNLSVNCSKLLAQHWWHTVVNPQYKSIEGTGPLTGNNFFKSGAHNGWTVHRSWFWHSATVAIAESQTINHHTKWLANESSEEKNTTFNNIQSITTGIKCDLTMYKVELWRNMEAISAGCLSWCCRQFIWVSAGSE